MDQKRNPSLIKQNSDPKPLRRRGVSFSVLHRRDEPSIVQPDPKPILVDYSCIREQKQLKMKDFLYSDNPITFFLFTFWHMMCLFGRLLILPFTLIKQFYLLILKVYGVRRPNSQTNPSDLFSISPLQSSMPQKRPIVWILTVIDFCILQLTQFPNTFKNMIFSVRWLFEWFGCYSARSGCED